MNRSKLAATCVLTFLIATLSMLSPAGADEALTVVTTDVTSYPDVRVVVAAPTGVGDQVLTDTAFRVTEGNEVRPVVSVDSLASDQLEVALVLDTSGSMNGAPLAAAKTAATSFLAQLPTTASVSVLGFGGTSAVLSARSTDRAAQESAIVGLKAGGPTALYEAVGAALGQLPPAGPDVRRAVVLLTDGGDTSSAVTLDETVKALADTKIPLYAVELQTRASNGSALGRLTAASAGRVVPASDPSALSGAFGDIAGQLVRQYAVTYRSQGRGSADVDIVLDASGVRAGGRVHLDLPSPAVTEGGRQATPPVGSWALVLGGGLCGTAILVLLLGLLGARVPRARGLAPRKRGIGMAAAADRAEALSETVLRRRGGVARMSEVLDAAGIDIRPGELLIGVVVADLLAFAVGWTLISPVVGVLVALAVPLLTKIGLGVFAKRRRKRFADQLAESLQILAGSLRAGHGLAQSIDTVARESESPTAEEVRRLSIEVRLGRDFVEALGALADRMASEDFQWVVHAIEIQRDVGGDLAEVLDSVAGTIRDRTRIRRQVSALSAEGRMSAWVLMVLPFGLVGVMSATNASFVSPLFTSARGYKLLAVGAALLTVGGLWLRRIVKPTF